ncbi:hypothetical protein ACIRPK_32175 [Kitasatospora sp. NPDC101801]|uniref:hypothetical protein n=1 Tax=Kitasatospora sp. NPDC101801 TaxID=3364103 RepID=UPI00380EBD20
MDLIGSGPGLAAGSVAALVSFAVLFSWRRAVRRAWQALAATAGPPRPATTELDLYEFAYLYSGMGLYRAPAVALVRMHAEGRISLTRKQFGAFWFRVSDPVPRDEVEGVLLAEIARTRKGRLPDHLGWDRDPPAHLARSFRERLVTEGLVTERTMPAGVLADSPAAAAWRAERRRLRLRCVAALVALLLTGAAVAVLSRAWLPLAAQLAVLLAAAIRRRRPEHYGRTDLGRTLVAATQARPLPADAELLRRVATQGLERGLPAGHPLKPVPPPPPPPAPPREPDPPRQEFNLDSTGLGGL